MQHIKLVNAYTTADQMRHMEYYNGEKLVRSERELPFEQASALVNLFALTKPHYDRYVEQEKLLASTYAKKDENGNVIIDNGNITFESTTEKTQFDTALKELKETDVPVENLPIKMAKPNTVRCSWLESLSGIVEFV